MQSKVSVRGQTVIPREIRKALGITPKSTLRWKIEDGVMLVYHIPADPVWASIGILKGKWTFEEFLKERNEERAQERARELAEEERDRERTRELAKDEEG
jgi:bifunctional DNA-binding transcriptional regulator/antitoxin component of YhaV-PrlF toxin-antitoxin module